MATNWPQYTTVANLKAYGDATASKDDALLLGIIKSFTASIERYISQSFLTQSVAQVGTSAFYSTKVDRNGFLLFYPPVNPISAITSLQYRVRGGGSNWTSLDPTQLEIENKDSGAIVRVISPDFGPYRQLNTQIQVNLTGGYLSADDLPPDLEFAARRLCWWAYKQKGAPMDRTANPETGQITVPGYWPSDIKTLLAPFVCYYTR